MPEQGTVEADLTYCVDTGVKPVNETFGEGNVERKYTGTFSSHKMAIMKPR